MARPTDKGVSTLKRLAHYSQKMPRAVLMSGGHNDNGTDIHVIDGAGWAECRARTRSTSGGVIVLSRMTVKSWSFTQGSIATSSGESELDALVWGVDEALGLQAMLEDVGWRFKPKLHVDISAAKGVSVRAGLGKTRHVQVR